MTVSPSHPSARVSPTHTRRLTSLFMRLQQQARDEAQTTVRRELRGVVAPSGKVRDHAMETGGDVVGDLSALEVIGIGHHPLAIGNALDGQGLVYRTADSKLHWEDAGSGSSGGHYEAVVTGFINEDGSGELVWENGELVYEGPLP